MSEDYNRTRCANSNLEIFFYFFFILVKSSGALINFRLFGDNWGGRSFSKWRESWRVLYIYIGDNFATTRGRTNARSKDLIGQRRVDDSRVIRFNAYNAYNRGRREGREGSVFFSIISRCKSPRFHLGHVSPADYILTGQYIRIDNGTISLDICLSFFYLFSSIPFVPLFFFFPPPFFFLHSLSFVSR